MGGRLLAERAGLARGPFHAEQATSVALPAAASLPAVLPIAAVSPTHVQQVVGDLEGGAEVAAEGGDLARAPARRGRGWRPPRRCIGSAGRSSAPAAARPPAASARWPSASMSIICPPAMPRAPLASARAATSSHRASGSGWVAGSARTSNARACRASPARMAVASSNAVRARLAAAQVVVVHRRQVVMHQRIGVQHLHGRRHPAAAARGHVEQSRHLQHQKGAHALAAVQAGIQHRLDQPRLGARRLADQIGARRPRLRCAASAMADASEPVRCDASGSADIHHRSRCDLKRKH